MLLDILDNITSKYVVILVSQSENRKRILQQTGITDFVISPSQFKEDLDKSLFTPLEYVLKTSEGKLNDKIQEIQNVYA